MSIEWFGFYIAVSHRSFVNNFVFYIHLENNKKNCNLQVATSI